MIEVPKLVNGGKRKLVFPGFEPPTVMASERERERERDTMLLLLLFLGGWGGVGLYKVIIMK